MVEYFSCFWSALPIQDINTSAPILFALWMFICCIHNGKLVSSYWPKFTALRLFVETMPIYKAVATGNRNIELYRETTRSICKSPQCQTEPELLCSSPHPFFFVTIYLLRQCPAMFREMVLAEIGSNREVFPKGWGEEVFIKSLPATQPSKLMRHLVQLLVITN